MTCQRLGLQGCGAVHWLVACGRGFVVIVEIGPACELVIDRSWFLFMVQNVRWSRAGIDGEASGRGHCGMQAAAFSARGEGAWPGGL